MNQIIHYHWIDTDEKLKTVCENACRKSAVALDTEFIRTRSYYPKLGLIQLFDGDTVSLIDPNSISDFSPFIGLLTCQNVVKVLHACSEDLEVFQHLFKQLPTPLADTQIMAGFAGGGISLGFAKLVAHYLNVELDKGASRTDWLARPLTEEQLQYAAADVWYLLPVYQRLVSDLDATRWQNAVEQECRYLLSKRESVANIAQAYKDISNAWRLEPQQLAILKVLAKWRIEEAEKRDLALNFVVKENCLFEIAKLQPKHTSQLLEFMHPNEVRIHGKKLLMLVEQGLAVLPENYPEKIIRLVDQANYKYKLKAMQQKLAEIQPPDLVPELLASKRQLNQLFSWHQQGQNEDKLPELLSGWRREFGLQILSVL
ncbi:ribonuclease D [Actinobacillus pleuropneumoniae]|uniref:Ribonuclease D n=1 Tax=Actinobacillus pleuropneumoniae TaxID=715 RepID=A0A9Q4DHB9_ACTPL|nr:ribonuclease D [Actinobacillus pleuropneumoniae]MCL7720374.1 ribonuclease D [Actinobacillus pleuropneumoniae]MCL7728079.1 ribonuclease D [Actinobacillus pleuropneumoniae]MCL7729569.1 ribonuclease D [Actinobacillus pleuropneumoniae]MCY6367550.1 ribonuclease D [Actinobacillus pleuropneumoniae]MCY6384418.1 ribonuclease D [Actinobacillus pleuropneumoniae]